jgi:hypothetical protein
MDDLNLKQRSILTVFETLNEDEKMALIPFLLLEADVFVYDFSRTKSFDLQYLTFSKKLIAQLSSWSKEGFMVRKSLIDTCYHIYKIVIEQSHAAAIGSVNPPKYYFYNDLKALSGSNFCDITPIKDNERELWFERTVDINYHNIILHGKVGECWGYTSLLYLFNTVEQDPKKVEDMLRSAGYNLESK